MTFASWNVVDDSNAAQLLHSHLSTLLSRVSGLRGVLLATADGHPLAHILPGHSPGAMAAVVASSLALCHRLADLISQDSFEEATIRSGSGYIVVYAVGDWAVLTVLTHPSANLARLHLEARDRVAVISEAVNDLHRQLIEREPTHAQ